MKKHTTLFVTAILALVLALFIGLRITLLRSDFDKSVRKALRTSAGYDQAFIGMVNRLEEKLANRASFGYQGGKDPMTGRVRQVVLPPPRTASVARIRMGAEKDGTPARIDPARADPVKLTAIIYDDKNSRYTAIVMDGERSLSLEVGDHVRDRLIRKITDKVIIMEGDGYFYSYDVYGNSAVKSKQNQGD